MVSQSVCPIAKGEDRPYPPHPRPPAEARVVPHHHPRDTLRMFAPGGETERLALDPLKGVSFRCLPWAHEVYFKY